VKGRWRVGEGSVCSPLKMRTSVSGDKVLMNDDRQDARLEG
jgi:hypothetical protein